MTISISYNNILHATYIHVHVGQFSRKKYPKIFNATRLNEQNPFFLHSYTVNYHSEGSSYIMPFYFFAIFPRAEVEANLIDNPQDS